ncbi:pyridoxal 5'-phosphate synthase [Psychromicrobium sp. YIM B11713]|uniref:pyridoxine/pyridoxamine 5'-phosphate oxidase n=1 Tax=Psychromicrobium sp. YIM B11713 TaxID=3145233 RepID=UPI00374F2083
MTDLLRASLRALPDFPEKLPDFDLASAPDDPEELFLEWLEQAIEQVPQPHAFSLATATDEGRPSSRMLILKNLDQRGWHFATSRSSRKATELALNPWVAGNFFWQALGRQIRFSGPVTALSAAASAADWLERPWSDGRDNPEWQLYAVQPVELEFWQARHDRAHRRLIYRRDNPGSEWFRMRSGSTS